jgi:hypothetical protein
MSTKNNLKLKSTRKRRNRNGHSSQQRRKKNSSAYTIRRGGFLTPFKEQVKQRYTAFRQDRAIASDARTRESQARIARNESPRFRRSPGRWVRSIFRRNRSNSANPPPVTNSASVINPSIYTHDELDPSVTDHYIQIFSEASTASQPEKDKAMEDMKKYIDAVQRNTERNLRTTTSEANTAVNESRAISDILSRDLTESSQSRRPSRSSRPSPHPPPPPAPRSSQFRRRRSSQSHSNDPANP